MRRRRCAVVRRGCVPVGYLITVGLVGVGIASALRPPFRSWPMGLMTWIVSAIPNESPFLAFYWVLAATALAVLQGDLYGPWLWVGLSVASLTLVGTPVLVRRSLRAAQAVERGLDQGLGEAWRDARPAGKRSTAIPWARILFAPVPLLHPGVKRLSNISYGDAGRRNRLDLYRRRNGGATGPVLIHLHGGGSTFAPGRKSFYSRRLLFRLARQGWVCISATYSFATRGHVPRVPDRHQEADRVDSRARHRTWRGPRSDHPREELVRRSPRDDRGLHEKRPRLSTRVRGSGHSVKAIVGLDGYYGSIDSPRQPPPSSPFDYVERGCPPLLIIHGDHDTFTSATRARSLVEEARKNPTTQSSTSNSMAHNTRSTW